MTEGIWPVRPSPSWRGGRTGHGPFPGISPCWIHRDGPRHVLRTQRTTMPQVDTALRRKRTRRTQEHHTHKLGLFANLTAEIIRQSVFNPLKPTVAIRVQL